MDIFLNSDIKSILHNKFVVIIGDSIQRGIYKDLVLLLQENRYLREKEMRDKGEYNFLHDELIEGGRKGEMINGTNYAEVRQYQTDFYLIRFYFVTRCYNAYVASIMEDLKQKPYPDIVIMNSCLWDITRYGLESIVDYKKNLVTLFERFKKVLDSNCLMIWNSTLPISNKARGGFLIPEIEFRTTTLRLDILEANYYARSVIMEHGFDILDLHFYLRHHIDKRVRDGIHWDMMAHRYITNLLFGHICKAFDIPVPQNKLAPFSSYARQTCYTDRKMPMESDFPNSGLVLHQNLPFSTDRSFPLQINFHNPDFLFQADMHSSQYPDRTVLVETDLNNNKQITHAPGPSRGKSKAKRKPPHRQPEFYNDNPYQEVDGSPSTNWMPFENVFSSVKGVLNAINCFQDNTHHSQFEQNWNGPAWDFNNNSNVVHTHEPYNDFGKRPIMGSRPHSNYRPQPQRGLGQNDPGFRPPFHTPIDFNGHRHGDGSFGANSFQPYQQNEIQGASYSRRRHRHVPYQRNY